MNGINGFSTSFSNFQVRNFNNFNVQQNSIMTPGFQSHSYMANSFSRGPAIGSNIAMDMSMARTQGFNQSAGVARNMSQGGGFFQKMSSMMSNMLNTVMRATGLGAMMGMARPSANAMGRAQMPNVPQLPGQAAGATKKKKGGFLSKLFGGIKKGIKGLFGGIKKGIGGLLKGPLGLLKGGLSKIGDLVGGLFGGKKGGKSGGGGLLGGLLGKVTGALGIGGKGGGLLGGILGKGGLGGMLGGLFGGGAGGAGALAGIAKVAAPLLAAI